MQGAFNFTVKVIVGFSVLFYLASLCFPASSDLFLASDIDVGTRTHIGFDLLFEGWEGLFHNSFAWLANITYVFAIVSFLHKTRFNAIIFSIFTLFLGLTAKWLIVPGETSTMLHVKFLVGYYLWIFSFALILLASFLMAKKNT